MRKIFFIYTFLIFCLFACESIDVDKEHTILEFEIKNIEIDEIRISNSSYSHKKLINNDKEKLETFVDTLTLPLSGYYNLFFNRNNIPLYLRRGTKTKIVIDRYSHNKISYSGNSQEENEYLLQKLKLKKLFNERPIFSLNESEFLGELFRYKRNLIKFLNDANVQADFKKQEIKEIDYEIAAQQLLYPKIHANLKGVYPELSDDFYENLTSLNFSDTLSYSLSQTLRYPLMVKYYYEKIAKDKRKEYGNNVVLAYLREIDKDFPSGDVKDNLFRRKMIYGLKQGPNLDNIFNTYKKAVRNQEYINDITEQYLALKNLQIGEEAPNFDLESLNNEIISLESLRGKNVYIDVWATWCGPCIKELPAFKRMAEKYEDIEFVSISIDRKEHYEKWKRVIEKYGLTNTQLIAYDKSDFQKQYAIVEIPRYILIDKKGKIVSLSAPNPSNVEFEKLLNSDLN
ncbi:TlpA family protein disulfide reductase [Gramella sp. BOM4]|nr:TlpA family protein disulfide reductase [Christiangramia bathymodioli]